MKDFAIEIAKKAGDYLLDHFRKENGLIKHRGLAKEVKIEQDIESDKIIVDAIQEKYPDHNLLTEESGTIDKGGEYTWIVDSLDGTGNYSVGNPFFAVSIAVMHKDELILGVVWAPFLEELYVAEKGKGATLNGKELKVSDLDKLESSYIVSCEGGEKTAHRIARIYGNIQPLVKDMRKLGSAALESCFVAAARAEAYVVLSIHAWDIGASVLIVQEAGGKITDFEGNPWKPEEGDYILSNGKIHDELLNKVNQALQ